MTQFQRILFPVDFSPQCHVAGKYVAAYARALQAEVDLLYVEEVPVEPTVWLPKTEVLVDMLDRYMQEEFAGLRVRRFVEMGSPAQEIVKYAENAPVDLIMLATHGRGPFRRFLLGSVTTKVLHDAACAVWTAAHLREVDTVLPKDAKPFANILCAVDLDEHGIHTLRHAADMARRFGSHVTAAHAVPAIETWPESYMDAEFQQNLIEIARARLANMTDKAGLVATPCVGAGKIAPFISHAAKAHNADLVLIGRGRPGLLGRLRTHDYAIIRECECPVLSI